MNHGGLICYYFANSSIQDYVGKSATRAKLQYFSPHEAHSKECFFIFFIKKKENTKLN